MRHEQGIGLVGRLLAACLLLMAVAGCGYSLRPDPSIKSVRLGPIRNLTSEPGLERSLLEALPAQLLRQGIRVDDGAAHEIRGSITAFSQEGTAERAGVSVQYTLNIGGSFVVADADGETIALSHGGVFIVTFGGDDSMQLLMADRQRAALRAMHELASELASSLARARNR